MREVDSTISLLSAIIMYYEDYCPFCDDEEPEMCPLHGDDNEDEDDQE